jgi:hypothetical protein
VGVLEINTMLLFNNKIQLAALVPTMLYCSSTHKIPVMKKWLMHTSHHHGIVPHLERQNIIKNKNKRKGTAKTDVLLICS